MAKFKIGDHVRGLNRIDKKVVHGVVKDIEKWGATKKFIACRIVTSDGHWSWWSESNLHYERKGARSNPSSGKKVPPSYRENPGLHRKHGKRVLLKDALFYVLYKTFNGWEIYSYWDAAGLAQGSAREARRAKKTYAVVLNRKQFFQHFELKGSNLRPIPHESGKRRS